MWGRGRVGLAVFLFSREFLNFPVIFRIIREKPLANFFVGGGENEGKFKGNFSISLPPTNTVVSGS
jgi:hypothetical protein